VKKIQNLGEERSDDSPKQSTIAYPIESAIVLRLSPENSRLNGLPTGAALAPGQPAQGGWMWAKLEGHKIRMWLVDKASLSIPFIPLCGKFSYMHAS
jgi:hypothetical protein